MRSWLKSAFVLMTILLVSAVFLAILYRPASPVTVPEAPRAYHGIAISLGTMTPEKIVVNQGTRVFLNVSSKDVDHIFALEPFLVETVVPANTTISMDFLATVVGTYFYRCTIVAPDHVGEKGTFVVVPSD